MEPTPLPLRCPHCNAMVVDRRSPNCTTCRNPLPDEWIMTSDQVAKLKKVDAQARAQHVQEMRMIDPRSDPNMPRVVRFLDTTWGM